MSTESAKMIKTEVSEQELALLAKLRNKRSETYNMRVSEKELAYVNAIKDEVEAAGTKFESRTEFFLHCVKTVATIAKSQTKLA